MSEFLDTLIKSKRHSIEKRMKKELESLLSKQSGTD